MPRTSPYRLTRRHNRASVQSLARRYRYASESLTTAWADYLAAEYGSAEYLECMGRVHELHWTLAELSWKIDRAVGFNSTIARKLKRGV